MRFIALIILVILILMVLHIDIRKYTMIAWNSYIYPFVSGEVFSGLGDKIREQSNLPEDNTLPL